MLTYQNYAAYTSKPSKEEKRKIVVSRNSKKTPPNSSPANTKVLVFQTKLPHL